MVFFIDIPTIGGVGTTTNRYGVEISGVSGSGRLMNNYGIYISSLSKGLANNWAIYSAGTEKSYLGGQLNIGTVSMTSMLSVKPGVNVNPMLIASSTGSALMTLSGSGNLTLIGNYLGNGGSLTGLATTTFNSITDSGTLGVTGTSTLATTSVSYLTASVGGYVLGKFGIGTTTPRTSLHVTNGTATTTIIIGSAGSGKGGCLEIRDSNDAGWTYCSVLGGVMTCGTASCE